MSLEWIMIFFASLIAIGILLHHPARTLGLPSLLIFMSVGLALGNGEFDFVYDNISATAIVGSMALNLIVFTGGINSSYTSIRVAYREGGMLSTFGVLFTTLFFSLILYYIIDLNFILCLLFAAIVSSTDAAAVFSILKSQKLNLKEQTSTVLEFESATNDPVALLMVVLLTGLALEAGAEPLSASSIGLELLMQIVVGLGMGWGIGKLSVWLLNRIKLEEYGLIPVFVLSTFILASYGADALGGNILIASYVSGAIIGNELVRGKELSKHFFNSLSWLAQALMFIILGLQIFPQQLIGVFTLSILPAALLILVARPLAVFLCYLPFRKASWRKQLFVSAIGLKGATPIVFALIPAAAGVPEALTILHMVFFVVLVSVFVQGGAIAPLARVLKLEQEDQNPTAS
ncbi:potassium/proton antiporter [Aestuariirhabdus sp. Z084]|uniref:potassium/proton antiporter n=1 Tax=Aestuariirhabdus haliotis TaxID=2918751 RepID=UPI00201B3FB5|nr:potassium/proton antiporter [Aestuariirhabdus haliotis]MCL6416836.1 potassium/proton antiporter [Aestuariirhabdus haliotis]MCL6420836.1 potassium/proton antiporter [Aestuariirhabdus haliotis]